MTFQSGEVTVLINLQQRLRVAAGVNDAELVITATAARMSVTKRTVPSWNAIVIKKTAVFQRSVRNAIAQKVV